MLQPIWIVLCMLSLSLCAVPSAVVDQNDPRFALFSAMLHSQNHTPCEDYSCQVLQPLLKHNGGDLSHVWKVFEIARLCECPSLHMENELVGRIFEILDGSTNSDDKFWAVRIAQSYDSQSWSQQMIDSAIESLFKNLDDTDAYIVDDTAERGSYYYLGHLLELIARSGLEKSSWSSVWNLAIKLFNSHGVDEEIVFYPHSSSNVDDIESTVTLLHGFYSMITMKNPSNLNFSQKRQSQLFNFLQRLHPTTELNQLLKKLGISTFATNFWKLPIIVNLGSNQINSNTNQIKFNVNERMLVSIFPSTLWGKSLNQARIEVELRDDRNSRVIVGAHELNLENDYFAFDITPLNISYGMYTLKVEARAPECQPTVSYGKILVRTRANLRNIVLATSDENRKIAFNSTTSLHLNRRQIMRLHFEITDANSNTHLVPQKLTVLCQEAGRWESLDSAPFAFKGVLTRNKIFNVSINTDKFTRGLWELRLVIGGTYISNPLEWTFAHVHVDGSGFEQSSLLEATSETLYLSTDVPHTKPITRFQQIASSVFTALMFVPLVLFCSSFVHLTTFKDSLFPSGPNALYALAFHALLALDAYILYEFWVQNNIFVTLKYLGPSSLVTAFFAFRTFQQVYSSRVQMSASKQHPVATS